MRRNNYCIGSRIYRDTNLLQDKFIAASECSAAAEEIGAVLTNAVRGPFISNFPLS